MFNIKKCSLDESITIYPYKNNTTSRLEFQEGIIKLALKTASFQQQNNTDEFNFLFGASAHVESESSLISLIIEQFDKGQKKFIGNQVANLVPTAPIPDALYMPARLIYESSLTDLDAISNSLIKNNSSCDDLANYYANSIRFLANYFHKFCTTIDSITKIMSLSSSIYFNNIKNPANYNLHNTILQTHFEMVTLANCFDAQRIQPISIIETSLLKTLQMTPNFYLKPKTGYCALYKNENIILFMDSEPKATKVPLMGIWVSGVQSLNHPLTWAACIRYAFSNLITNKSNEFQKNFVIILFSSISKRPEFYICKALQTDLEFTLFNGFSKLIVNKSSSENRCITIDMCEMKESYNFKLFSNTVTKTIRHQQDIYGQHLLLDSFNQQKKFTNPIHNEYNATQQTNRYHNLSKEAFVDPEIQPRSLSASVNWSKPSSVPNLNNSSEQIIIQNNKVANTSPITFANMNSNDVANQFKKNNNVLPNENAGKNIVVGSYHSVSDISVLSDNEIEDSIFSNSLNATTCSSMQNNSGSQNSSSNNYNYMPQQTTSNYKNKPPMVSQSDDFEFLRPKDPPLPTKANSLTSSTSRLEQKNKYNQHVYSCTSNSLSCSSNADSMSSLSPSPTPSFKNSSTTLSQSNLNQATPSNKLQSDSKSILFGIPRTYAPMPMTPVENYQQIDSPFVDVTLNNCDDMSLYQPINKFQMNNGSRAALSPLLEPEESPSTAPKPIKSNTTPVNNFTPKQFNIEENQTNSLKMVTPLPNDDIRKPMTYQNLPKNFTHQALTSASATSLSTNYIYNKNNIPQHQSFTNGITNQTNKEFSNQLYNHTESSVDNVNSNKHIQMLNYLNPSEIADQLMNKDNQLQSHLVEMKNLQEKMNSLNLINQKQQQMNSSTTPSSYNTHNNNGEISSVANAISKLSSQIEERKNIIKVDFFHSYENHQKQLSMNTTSFNNNNSSSNISNDFQKNRSYEHSFNTSIEHQRLSSSNNSHESGPSSEYNSIVYPANNSNTSNFNHESVIQQQQSTLNLNQQQQNYSKQPAYDTPKYHQFLTKKDYENSGISNSYNDDKRDNESSDDEANEQENVFSAALNDFKQQNWHQKSSQNQCQEKSKSEQTMQPLSGVSTIYEDQSLLNKFNYVSLLLDDYCDKNTSLNTKALAHKYLKDQNYKQTQHTQQQTTNAFSDGANLKGYDAQSEIFNSCYTQSGASSIVLDSAKYDKLFQYYSEAPSNYSLLDENEQEKLSQMQNSYNVNQKTSLNYQNNHNSDQQNMNNYMKNDNRTNPNFSNNSESIINFSNNFPAFPGSSSTCNSSQQLTAVNFNHQKQPTSTPRFNSFESKPMSNQTVSRDYDSRFSPSNQFNLQSDRSTEIIDQKSENSDDADSESENKNDDDDDDDEVWIFRKPQQKQRIQQPKMDAFKESQQKFKNRNRLEQQRRRNEEKDFSDQDEIDRDVTTVLDIEKLKRLPKLL